MASMRTVTRRCPVCGKEFTITRSQDLKKLYDSAECRAKAARLRGVEQAKRQVGDREAELNEVIYTMSLTLDEQADQINQYRQAEQDVAILATLLDQVEAAGLIDWDKDPSLKATIGAGNQQWRGLVRRYSKLPDTGRRQRLADYQRIMRAYGERIDRLNQEGQRLVSSGQTKTPAGQDKFQRIQKEVLWMIANQYPQEARDLITAHPTLERDVFLDQWISQWQDEHPGQTLDDDVYWMLGSQEGLDALFAGGWVPGSENDQDIPSRRMIGPTERPGRPDPYPLPDDDEPTRRARPTRPVQAAGDGDAADGWTPPTWDDSLL